jgi:hypothetical protein
MNSIRRMIAPLAVAFATIALVPGVAQAQEVRDAKPKAHDTWIEKAGSAVFHFLGLDTLSFGDSTEARDSLKSRPMHAK